MALQAEGRVFMLLVLPSGVATAPSVELHARGSDRLLPATHFEAYGANVALDCSNLFPVAILSSISSPISFKCHLRQFAPICAKPDWYYGGLRLLEFIRSCHTQLHFQPKLI